MKSLDDSNEEANRIKRVPRQAVASSDTRASNCKKCNYITKIEPVGLSSTSSVGAGNAVVSMASATNFKVLMCTRCGSKYHEKCLLPHERIISCAEQNWRCPDCKRCSNCRSQQNSEQLMTCLKCNTPTHYDCLPHEYKASLRPLYQESHDGSEEKKLNLQTRRYRC